MFALSRMVIRAGVLAALIATVMSVASAMAVQGEWEAIETHAETAFEWFADLLGRLGDIDPSVGDITLADLTSPGGWVDLGAGLFGGGEQPAEVGSVDVARLVDGVGATTREDLADRVVGELTLNELVDLGALGVGPDGLVVNIPSLGGE